MEKKIYKYIALWKNRGYPEDIPNSVPKELMRLCLAPSYKAICLAILKNDHSLKTLGFTQRSSPWYHELKRIEIQQRNSEE